VFGAANVERADVPVGEGNTEPGTVIFAKDPARRIDILWHDAYARPNVVIIRNGSSWPVSVTGLDKPVANGATLVEIEAMNGRPLHPDGLRLGPRRLHQWLGRRPARQAGRRLQPLGPLRARKRRARGCTRQGEWRRRIPVDRLRDAPDQTGRHRDRTRLAAVRPCSNTAAARKAGEMPGLALRE
jgi:hypothetical protein